MAVRGKYLIVLIGNDAIGKTTIQKNLVEILNGRKYTKLPSNCTHEFTHLNLHRKLRRFFVAGRSYQEFRAYKSVEEYFEKTVDQDDSGVDVAIMSSHLNLAEVSEMIQQGRRRFYNVCGLFFSNSFSLDMNSLAKAAAREALPYAEPQAALACVALPRRSASGG